VLARKIQLSERALTESKTTARAGFLADYRALLGPYFSPRTDGRVLFPFHRLFVAYQLMPGVAQRVLSAWISGVWRFSAVITKKVTSVRGGTVSPRIKAAAEATLL
jgi:hypothetical protein